MLSPFSPPFFLPQPELLMGHHAPEVGLRALKPGCLELLDLEPQSHPQGPQLPLSAQGYERNITAACIKRFS